MWLYLMLRRLLTSAVHVFFRQLVVVGTENLPPDGTPVIFAGNHPNSLLDPAIILVTCGRKIHFAAKDTLFRTPWARWFLGALGAVPVKRRHDRDGGDAGDGATPGPVAPSAAAGGSEPAVDNSAMFARLVDVLSRGGAMGIFPEGVSHDQAQVQRLKTGVARIAIDAVRRGLTVYLVPCGLNYVRPKRFRSRALVQYGTPMAIDAATLEELGAGDERAAVRGLTERIEVALRSLTINAEDWETLRVLDALRRLYQPPRIRLEDRIELARRFSAVYPRVRHEPVIHALYTRTHAWLERLDASGLSDRDLARSIAPAEVSARILRQLLLVLLWLPLAAPGFVVQAPVVYAIRVIGPRLTPRKDVIATTKLLLGMLMLPTLNVVLGCLVGLRFGIGAGVLTTLLLFLSAVATIKVLERGARLRHLLATSGRLLRFRHVLGELKAERDALELEVVRAVERYKPGDMVALFPRAARESVGSADDA